MLLPLALSTPDAPFSVDLFLVGSNPAPVRSLEWLEKESTQDTPIKSVLRPLLASRVAAKRTFVLMDGGDGSLFPKEDETVDTIVRQYSGYDSMTETRMVGGKVEKRVVERTESVETTTVGFTVRPNGQRGYSSQGYLHFGRTNPHPMVAMMDLNSYRTSLDQGMPQDREHLPVAVLLSYDSIRNTERFLEKTGVHPTVPILCRTGVPRASDRDLVAFPPEGVVSHYRLVQGEPGWRLEFVRFIRSGRYASRSKGS